MLKASAILVIHLIYCNCLVAQWGHYRFKSWDQQKGMPANSCLSVMQDHNGYIWISTVNGISRFNGVSFKETDKNDASILIEGEVRRIIEDKEGIFWLASFEKGLIRIDFSQPKEKKIQAFNPTTLHDQVCPPFQSVNRLLDDNTGHIWIGTESNGLYRFNKKTRTFVHWTFNNPYSRYSESIRCLYQTKDNLIWVGIVNGIIVINPLTGETAYPKTSYSGISYASPPTVRSICHWNTDTFAVATDRGAYFYHVTTKTFIPVFPIKDSLLHKNLEYHDVIKFSKEELWFATTDRGIWYANVWKKEYRYSWEGQPTDETVGRQPVFYFYRDINDHLWVGHNKGLSYLNNDNSSFKNFPFNFHVAQPPTKNFLAAWGGDVAIVRPDSLFKLRPSANSYQAVKLLYKGENIGGVQLWRHEQAGFIIVNPKGIFYADTLSHRAVPISLKQDLPDGLKQSGNIAALLFDTLKSVEQWWIGATETTFLYRYDLKNKTFVSYDMYKDGSSTEKKRGVYITRMLKDPNGGIWISTRNKGLFYLRDRTKEEFAHFDPNQPPGKRIPGNYIEDIKLDGSNNLWATIRGKGLVMINRRNPQKLSYIVYGKERGLTSLNLDQIQIDAENNLWISSTTGLYRFDQTKKWFDYFGQPNGIRNPVLTLASTKDSSGVIYFSSTDHLLSFNPKEINHKKRGASIRLLGVAVNDKMVDIVNKNHLRLNPGENTLRFEFDLLDFDNPHGHYLLCKLDGYDTAWLSLQDVFQQTYRSLAPGKYNFRLKKLNVDASKDNEINLAVTISEYFYNTASFRILATLIFGLTLVFIVRTYIIRKLEKQKLILEKKQAIELERLRISAELHDDVGGELSAIRLLSDMAQMNTTANLNVELSKISASSANLVQKINEIVWALNINNDTVQSLTSYIHRYAVKYLDDVGIKCTVTKGENIPSIEVDGKVRRNVFLLVKEALHNVVKHANANRVFIKIETTHQLCIIIHDNGIGIGEEQLTAGTGNGLSTMQKRAKDVNGTLRINNHEGTTIELRMPFDKIDTNML